MLLGSATPAVESYYNATTGKYGLATLTERYAGLQLPQIRIVDLQRQYHRKEMYDHFSDPLVERIREELAKHKQVILFRNRRGYAPLLQCPQCGQTPRCPNCDVPLTLHKQRSIPSRATTAATLRMLLSAATLAAARCGYRASARSA